MTDTDEQDLAWRCHANCIEYSRETARRAGAAGEIAEAGGVLLYATGSDFAVVANGVFRLDPAMPADEVLDRAEAWFADRGRGWSLATSSWGGTDQDLIDAAAQRGLMTTIDQPGMVCEQRLADADPPPGVEIRRLTTSDDAAAFIAMSAQAYASLGLPLEVFPAMAADPPAPEPPNLAAIGIFEDGVLLSGAEVLFSHGIAGVYCVGTRESARGRGLAELATRTVTNLAFDAGAPYVTLQASPMGEPIYRRLGYREIYRYANHTRFV